MKKKIILYFALFVAVSFAGCEFASQQGSYLMSFGYLGKSASSLHGAVLTGQVLCEKTGREYPLRDVLIGVNNQEVITDSGGRFRITLQPGDYDISVNKSGYKKLLIKGYHADSNEHAHACIMLNRGSDLTVFNVGRDKIRSSNHLK